MTDAQKMKVIKMLEVLNEDITNIEDSCDSLRYFIKNTKHFIANTQEDELIWFKFTDFDDTVRYKCTECGCIWKYPYNYCPNCGIKHRKEED